MIEACNVMVSEGFCIVYNLQDAHAWRQAHAHRSLWGRRFCQHCALDEDRLVIVFMPGGERWQLWEAHRRRLILGQALEGRAA
jgi:hypothetical protein